MRGLLSHEDFPRSIEADPASLDFGTTHPGSTVSRTLGLSNLGPGSLTLEEISLTGEQPSLFAVQAPAPRELSAGDTLSLEVRYQPGAVGSHTARLLIRSNANNSSELLVPLVGNADACSGKSCDQPPGQCYAPAGTCSGGACAYALKAEGSACDDQDLCTGQDACHAGNCVGTAATCNTPPAGTCLSSSSYQTYAATGTCSAGACSYAPSTRSCAGGCSNDVCSGDPCAALVCQSPPPPSCADATTRRTFPSAGACVDGGCSYAPADQACDAPPPPSCADAATRRAFDPSGTCFDGGCSYAPIDTACDSPPPPACANPSTLRTFASSGACFDGGCSYLPADQACAGPTNGVGFCDGGACGSACDPGFHSCGSQCASNSSPATCGTSCAACPAVANGTATCDGAGCGLTCNPSFEVGRICTA